jgi:pre-mRNA-splicing factor CWC22
MFAGEDKDGAIMDNTETNFVALWRTIYLTIHSSLDFEECAHKLMRMELAWARDGTVSYVSWLLCRTKDIWKVFLGSWLR